MGGTNTWVSTPRSAGPGSPTCQWYYCVAPTHTGASHTIGDANGGVSQAVAHVYVISASGVISFGASAQRDDNTNAGTSTSGTGIGSLALTPAVNGALILAAVMNYESPNHSAGSVNSPFTTDLDTPSQASGNSQFNGGISGHYVQPTAGAITPVISWTGTTRWAASALYFTEGAPASPTLSAPTGVATGATNATAGFTTDQPSSGTAYFLRRTGTTPASAATVIATGESQAAGANPQTRAMTSFTTNTPYYVDMAQTGATSVVSAGPFTPATLAVAGTALSAQTGTQGASFAWTGATPESLITNSGIGASGGWSASGLGASGLSVNTSTGVLQGTCGTPGTYSVTLTRADSSTAGTPRAPLGQVSVPARRTPPAWFS